MKRVAALIVFAVIATTPDTTAIDIVPSEASVAERMQHFDAVLRVRAVDQPSVRPEDRRAVLEAANPDITFNGPVLTPLIEQNVHILEVIKGASFATAGTTVRVGTSGGHNAMHLDHDWRRRTLVAGGTYVLFVRYNAHAGQLRYQLWDLFRLDGVRVTAAYEAPYAQALLERSPSAALALIRDAVGRTTRSVETSP